MVTDGIDLAALPKRTAVCWMQWGEGRAEVVRLEVGADDDALIAAIREADKVGIDVPFGWPVEFVRAVAAYNETGVWPETAANPTTSPKQLQFRETDRFVRQHTGWWPLSVSSDRLAIPTMRAAALFSRLAAAGQPVARDGSGKIVEVYPAAALHMWEFNPRRYKRKKNRDTRCTLLGTLTEATTPWLSWDAQWLAICENSDDALDAMVAALVARAAWRQLCVPVPPLLCNWRHRRDGLHYR